MPPSSTATPTKHEAGANAVNAAIFKVLGHPTRSRIMVLLTELEASPSEIAERLGENLEMISYHVREMAKVEPAIIEQVGTKPGKRGGLMKVYRACARPILEVATWEQMPRLLREVNSVPVAQLVVGDLHEAIAAGTFDARAGRTLIRLRGVVDEQGYEEMEPAAMAYLDEIDRIITGSIERMSETGAEGINVSTATLAFEVPAPSRNGGRTLKSAQ
jgi:DNA-binding transcriptional ArsR family regulator